jgi:hypothetical protein
MFRAPLLLVFLTAVGLGAAHANPCAPSEDVRRVHVRAFDAVGDGKTDDGPAIRAALNSALTGAKPVALEFDPGKTYRVTSFDNRYALQILSTSQITILGNGAELLLLPPNMVMRIHDSSDVTICNLSVDYSPLPFTQGLVVAADPASRTFEVEIEPGFDIPVVNDAARGDQSQLWRFAKPFQSSGGFAKRINIKAARPAGGDRRITLELGNAEDVRRLTPKVTRLVMVMPGMGHAGNAVFWVMQSDRVHLEGIRLYAVPKLSFYIADNHGAITFRDVQQRIRPASNRVMSGWRGVFHVLDNRGPVQWDGCYVEGAFDDAFNISAMYQVVSEQVGANSWRLTDLSAAGAPIYKPGDRLQAIDLNPTRKLLGESRIVSVASQGAKDTVVTLSDSLPLKAAKDTCTNDREVCGSRVVNLDVANAGSVIRNCTIHGGARFRSRVLVERTTFDGNLRITADPTRVGPLPDGVVIRDSELSGQIRIGSDRPSGRIAKQRGHQDRGGSSTYHKGWDTGERWARNIILQNNRIHARLRADGASFSLIDNDITGLSRKSLQMTNSGPVYILNLTAGGVRIPNPMSRIRIGNGMTDRDIILAP